MATVKVSTFNCLAEHIYFKVSTKAPAISLKLPVTGPARIAALVQVITEELAQVDAICLQEVTNELLEGLLAHGGLHVYHIDRYGNAVRTERRNLISKSYCTNAIVLKTAADHCCSIPLVSKSHCALAVQVADKWIVCFHLPVRGGGEMRMRSWTEALLPFMQGKNVIAVGDSNMFGDCSWTQRIFDEVRGKVAYFGGPSTSTYYGIAEERAELIGYNPERSALDLAASTKLTLKGEPTVTFPRVAGSEVPLSDHALVRFEFA